MYAQQRMMSIEDLKNTPTADSPGKTVGAILNAKRLSSSHGVHVQMLKAGINPKPVVMRGGQVVDGHHTIAAAEDAGLTHLLVEHR